jgi:hypothetical protein
MGARAHRNATTRRGGTGLKARHASSSGMSLPQPRWSPPTDQLTQPDQLPPEAWRAVNFFEGEHVVRCWQTARGYLVLTNLRCGVIWPSWELFHRGNWQEGPQYFFYNLRPPAVLLGRFVELREAFEEEGRTTRFRVRDPEAVAEEIAAAIGPGRGEWAERRERTRRLMEGRRIRRGAGAGARAPLYLPYPCRYCGNPIPAASRQCPSCGAPVG